MQTKKDIERENRNKKFKTNYRRTYEASPIYRFRNSALSPAESETFDIGEREKTSQKWLPLTNLRIVNNSAYNLILFPNQQQEGMVIPAGTILSFDRKTIPALYSFRIQNIDSSNTINADLIDISVWKEAVEFDQAFAQMHKAFFNFLSKSKNGL